MAKAAWLTVAPASGNGNATVQNTGAVHTGREQRTTTVTGVAVGVSLGVIKTKRLPSRLVCF